MRITIDTKKPRLPDTAHAYDRLTWAATLLAAGTRFQTCVFRKRTNGRLRKMYFRLTPDLLDDEESYLEYVAVRGLATVCLLPQDPSYKPGLERTIRYINLDGIKWIKCGHIWTQPTFTLNQERG